MKFKLIEVDVVYYIWSCLKTTKCLRTGLSSVLDSIQFKGRKKYISLINQIKQILFN